MITRDQLKKDVAYRVIENTPYAKKGDIVYLIEDDGSNNPYFSKDKNDNMDSITTSPIYLYALELAEPVERELEEIVKERNDLLAQANKLTSIIKKRKTVKLDEVWKPKMGELYYFVNADNEVSNYVWKNDLADLDMFKSGNYYCTEAQAQSEAMRRRSMKRGIMPRVGEKIWTWYVTPCVIEKPSDYWDGDKEDIEDYHMGRIFLTEKDRDEHCEKYKKFWTEI